MKIEFNNKVYEKNKPVKVETGNGLGRLCFDIFKYFLEKNKNYSYKELQNIFNSETIHEELSSNKSNRKVIFNESDFNQWHEKYKLTDSKSEERYFGFGGYSNPVEYNNEKLYFTTQWGSKNIPKMIGFAKGKNYDIKVLEWDDSSLKNFYGLWTPRNNQDKIEKCLQSGVWYRGDGGFNKEVEARKIASMRVGDKVFLYDTAKDVKVKDSPFAQYLPEEYVVLGYTVVKAKCLGVGKVVSTNIEDLSVTVDWDKDYQESEWYLYTRQDGIWWFDGKTQDKYKAQVLYDIVFNGKEQDYKWWAENGGFNMDIITEQKANKNNEIKNIIFYGSPGVGKTHNTKKLISLIESGISEKEIFETIKNNHQNNGIDIYDIKERVKFVTFHQSFGYEDFIEGFRPNEDGDIELQDGVFKTICDTASKDRGHKYYLVIDEINRGNISKIFGELITLIEEDKRDTLEVTLPYSKQTFKIPSNLYIIGTMNSTDKSIALIDIALRRRFTFLKMEPKSDLVKYNSAKTIMEQLNAKITETLGADYVLGHSYFMKITNEDDLEFVLEYKIIPLLEEYYYGDISGLNEVLNICKLDAASNGNNK